MRDLKCQNYCKNLITSKICTQDNVRKSVGILNCFTIAKTSDLNLFQ